MRIRFVSAMVFLLAATASTAAYAAENGGFGLSILVNDALRPEYPRGSTVYIEAIRGEDYALRITNPLPYRVAVALSVDGLNTIDARHTPAATAAKWVLDPYETAVISGWQVSDRAARRFFFTGEKRSYGARLGQTENLGVIEAVFYRERQPIAVYAAPAERNAAAGASKDGQPMSRAESAAAPAPASKSLSDEYAATGMGGRTRHEVERVAVDLEDRPAASIRIRYEFRAQLVKLGIFPDGRDPIERREQARGFGGYCPE